MAKLLSFSHNQGFHGEWMLRCSLGWRELAQAGSVLGSSYIVFSLSFTSLRCKSRAGGLQESFPLALAIQGLMPWRLESNTCVLGGGHSLLDPPGISGTQESMLTQLAFHQNMQGFFRS